VNEPFPFSRRGFLSGAGALLATAFLPTPSLAAGSDQSDWFTASENTLRKRRVLKEPLLLAPGEPMMDTDYIVPVDFKRTGPTHAITAHPSGLKVRNCRILFETDKWLERWQLPLAEQPSVGISRYVSGLQLPATSNVDIDGLHIEGAPNIGIEAWDVTDLKLRRYSVARCHYGAHFAKRVTGNRNFDVNEVRAWGLWGPPSTRGLGQDCWVSEGYQINLQNFFLSGTTSCGAKICGPGYAKLKGITTPSIMFQGRATVNGTERLEFHLQDLFINAATGSDLGGNKVQISWGVTGVIDGGYIDGAGCNGHGMQITGDCQMDVRNVVFRSLKGKRGNQPAYALELDVRPPPQGSTINADFERVNTFVDQPLRVRRAG
jgi:hypothetical protein